VAVNGGSGYFDGSGDNIQVTTATSAVVVTGGAFTIEAWAYNMNNAGSYYMIISEDDGSSTGQCFQFRVNASKLELVYFTTSARASAVTVTSTATVPINAWNHLAVSWGGANTPIKLFINGVLDTTTSNVAAIYAPATIKAAVGSQILSSPAPGYWTGYISDARMLKGTQLYTVTFTPPTAPLTAITNTALLCNMTNAAIIDNAMINDLETVGGSSISTAQSQFGGSSILLNGTTGYLNIPANVNWAMRRDCTIECWAYRSAASNGTILDQYFAATTGVGNWQMYVTAAGVLNWYYDGSSAINSGATTLSTGQWYHIAFVRSSGTLKMYLNGTAVGSSVSFTGLIGQNNTLWVGAQHSGGPTLFWNGYLDDIRITNGYARYTANFTAPTAPFPVQ
jgi:hypothetical protein